MHDSLPVAQNIVIPAHEIEITASRAGGPGGQHVNKTSTRITVRWNVPNTTALTDEQKQRVLERLASELTAEGDLIIHCGESRSQYRNKKEALARLGQKVRHGLKVPKKRMKTRVSKKVKEKRLVKKKKRGEIKKARKKVIID